MMELRKIQAADNAAMARVIRTVMPEFNCVGEGFSITDPEVDDMEGAYASEGSAFFVVTAGGAAGAADADETAMLFGGAGYAPLAGADGTICELRKMYLLPAARGRGAGRQLMEACLAGAKTAGYTHIYLETVSAMTAAARLYQKFGFEYLSEPLGNTGHGGCNRYMLRAL